MTRNLLNPIILFAFLAALLLGMLQHQVVLLDPDTGWHTRAGDVIRETGSIPKHDPWSWTAGEKEWLNISWLPDIGMSLIHEQSGLTGLKKTTIFLFAVTIGILGWVGMRLRLTLPGVGIALFYTIGVMYAGMLARPQMLTLLFAALSYALIRFGSPRQLWLFVPLQWLWANCHGGYTATYVLMGLFIIEAYHAKNRARVKQLIVIGIASFLVIFLNPYGLKLLDVTGDVLTTPANAMINEWSATAPAEHIYLLGWFVILLCCGGMQDKSIPLADKLLAVFWLIMGLVSFRLSYVAAIYVFPYLAQSLSQWSRQVPNLAGSNVDLENKKLRMKALAGVVAALALLVSPIPGKLWQPSEMELYNKPVKEVAYILEHYPNMRFFTHFNYGGYIIYETKGRLKVFMDGRTETAYPREVMEDYMALQDMRIEAKDDTNWHTLVKKYNIEGLLVPTVDAQHNTHLLDRMPEWKRVFTGDVASVYVKKSAR